MGERADTCALAILDQVTSPTAPKPFDLGRLRVGDEHVLYYEQVGKPDGLPIVYVHGGPGS